MAGTVSNIRLPDGTTVSVPAWASEATMEQVANYMAATNKVDQKFLTLMKGVGSDVDSLQRNISGLVQSVNNNANNIDQNKKQDKDVARSVKNLSEKLMQTSRFFGDSQAPVSSMVKSLGELVSENKNMPGMIDRMMQRLPAGGFIETGVRTLGVATDVAIDAALAYAGWNAAKLEQFAEAQGKIIDVGAIFYSSSQAFDDLYSASLSAGVTYNNMIDTYAQYNAAMISLGGSVSQGAMRFTDMFGALNQATDEFGDLGLNNSQLLEQYAVYIDHLRLTGQTNRMLSQGEDALSNSFIDLQIESAALANLTSLSRTEAIQRRMQALNEPVFAMSMERFSDAGLQGESDVFAAIGEVLALTGADSLQPLLDAMAMEGSQINLATGLQDFSIVDRLDPDQRYAIETMMPGLIDYINQSVREGTLTSDEIQQEILKRLVQSHEDYDELVGDLYLTSNDPRHAVIMQLASDARRIEQEFGALARLTPQEFRDRYAETQRAIGEAGSVVVDMNKMTTTFLRIQDAATMSMSRTGEIFSEIAQLMENSVDTMREMFGLDAQDSGAFGEYFETGGTDTGGHPMGYDMDAAVRPQATPSPSRPTPGVSAVTPNPVGEVPGSHQIDPRLDSDFASIITDIGDQLGVVVVNTSGVRDIVDERSGLDTAGSTSGRHTGGYAADIALYDGDRRLSVNNPQDVDQIQQFTEAFLERAVEMGYQPGVGIGSNYMGGDTFHFDVAGGRPRPAGGTIAPGYWGNNDDRAGAVPWLGQTYDTHVQRRRFGGLVNANIPYIVGDQLGLSSAELFMPGTDGTIVNNQNLNRLFQASEQLTGALTGDTVATIVRQSTDLMNSPEFNGILAENQNLQRMVQNISNTELANLTSSRSTAIIRELRDEYASIIETKAQSLRTMRALVDAVRLINRNKNRQASADIINSV
jgi:hypothetical protein